MSTAVRPKKEKKRLLDKYLINGPPILIFIVVPVARSSSSLHPSRAHLHVVPVARPSSLSHLSRAHLHVAPITRPSSLSRPSRTHLHGAHLHCPAHCTLIFMTRLLHAHLHCHAHHVLIFIVTSIARFSSLLPTHTYHLHCNFNSIQASPMSLPMSLTLMQAIIHLVDASNHSSLRRQQLSMFIVSGKYNHFLALASRPNFFP